MVSTVLLDGLSVICFPIDSRLGYAVSCCVAQLKHVAQLVHLYPAAVSWQHVAVPRAKTPGAPGSTPRRDVRLLLEVRAAEDAAAVTGDDIGGLGATGEDRATTASPGKTPQKSMPALRAELAHRLALHYMATYRCAGE